ncbi:MAG: hypothetical protein ACYDEA_04965 [Candidatus Dormibacteria bacterium]
MAISPDLWIKVPAPFFGVETVGFSVRYALDLDRDDGADVPFFVEGEAGLIGRLIQPLRLFPQRDRFVDCRATGEAYSWTDPISLSDEVIVMAFRDQSLNQPALDPVQAVRNRLINQMVPLAFPFLRDCVRVAGLRLNAWISVRITSEHIPEIDLSVPVGQIVADNGIRALAEL